MDKEVKEFLDEMLEITNDIEYVFEKRFGLTFVFRRDITFIRDKITSAEIIPIGIIYEENDQYYFAPYMTRTRLRQLLKNLLKKKLFRKRYVFTSNNNFNNQRT